MNALRDGIRRVNDAPAILFGVWLLTLGLSVPLTLASQAARSGRDLAAEFFDHATGVVVRPPAMATQPLVDIPAPAVDEARGPFDPVGATYFIVWLFLAGGILDRYARDRATRSQGFFAASGVFFFRFLRVAIVLGAASVLLPRPGRVPVLAVFGVLVDYALVQAVVEDRRSMLSALSASGRFVAANVVAVAALYLADVTLFATVVFVWSRIAPSGTEGGVALWSRFVTAQVYVLARVWVKLVFWSSEISLYQSRLAHAGYVARTQPPWPESPSAEAIGRT